MSRQRPHARRQNRGPSYRLASRRRRATRASQSRYCRAAPFGPRRPVSSAIRHADSVPNDTPATEEFFRKTLTRAKAPHATTPPPATASLPKRTFAKPLAVLLLASLLTACDPESTQNFTSLPPPLSARPSSISPTPSSGLIPMSRSSATSLAPRRCGSRSNRRPRRPLRLRQSRPPERPAPRRSPARAPHRCRHQRTGSRRTRRQPRQRERHCRPGAAWPPRSHGRRVRPRRRLRPPDARPPRRRHRPPPTHRRCPPARDLLRDHVRQVVAKLELGEADAGFVYRTDVQASDGRLQVIERRPRSRSPPATPPGVLRDAPSPALAQRFLTYLRSPKPRPSRSPRLRPRRMTLRCDDSSSCLLSRHAPPPPTGPCRPRGSCPDPTDPLRTAPPALLGPDPVWLLAALALALVLAPVGALIARGVTQADIGAALTSPFVRAAVQLSLITSVIAVAAIVALGTPTAYLLARRRFPGRALVDAVIDLPIVLPPVVGGLALLLLLGRQGPVGGPLDGAGLTWPSLPLPSYWRRCLSPRPSTSALPGRLRKRGPAPGGGVLHPGRPPVANLPPHHHPAGPPLAGWRRGHGLGARPRRVRRHHHVRGQRRRTNPNHAPSRSWKPWKPTPMRPSP